MSLSGRPVATEREYSEKIERIARKIGENPARFLDQNLVERGPSHTTTSGRDLFIARVRGIDKIGVVNGWIAVEKELDRGPRDRVIELLERRRDSLIEHGERVIPDFTHDELVELSAKHVDGDPDDEPVWRHVACGTTDVEQESARSWFCETCEQRTNRVERVDDRADTSENLTNASA